MNNEEIQYNYYEYVSPYNILVVTHDGEIINVLCPLKVKAKTNFPEIKKGEVVWIQKVQLTAELKDVFVIGENAYLVQYFNIILD